MTDEAPADYLSSVSRLIQLAALNPSEVFVTCFGEEVRLSPEDVYRIINIFAFREGVK